LPAAIGYACAAIVVTVFLAPSVAATPLAELPIAGQEPPGSGSLLLRGQAAGPSDTFHVAPLLATEASIEVGGLVARATVRQHFHNTSDDWVEGLYMFPLPESAAVDGLRMRIGARVIEGHIHERAEARRLYEEARDQGRKASLLESERPNIFTTSVANIGPDESIVVEIEYQQVLRYDAGAFELRFPMVVGPRYVPAPVASVNLGDGGWAMRPTVPGAGRISAPVLHPEEGKINPVSLTLTLAPGFPVTGIESLNHAVDLDSNENGATVVTLADGVVPADRDFVLGWRPDVGNAPRAGLFAEAVGDETYLLAMLLPPDPDAADAIPPAPPRELIVVLDISGSMGGSSIHQAKAAAALAVSRLDADDHLNVIVFNNNAGGLFPAPRIASAENKATAQVFIEGLQASGGTNMAPALEMALQGSAAAGSLRQVVFLTDGAVGNESYLFELIDRQLGATRLFTIGIGSAPNSYFMAKASETGRGTYTHIGNTSEIDERMAALFAKLESPTVTDITLLWPDGTAPDMSRAIVPDLYAGEPVVLTARLAKADGELVIAGRHAGREWRVGLDLAHAAPAAGIGKLWARDRIDALSHRGGAYLDPAAAREAIVALALEHHLVTKHTSLVAIDVTPTRPDGTPLLSGKLPLNLPAGWDYDKVFGERSLTPQEDAARGGFDLASAEAPAAIGSHRGIGLPQGATPAELNLLIGLMLILAGLWLWRRRVA
ncbi:MAG: marine proteobacterial sortase target protein, partial [Alphaproteobacteria bacterium]|nr:marine proteobacterial sortase target protein [Alphaproteobacteria bacterium]